MNAPTDTAATDAPATHAAAVRASAAHTAATDASAAHVPAADASAHASATEDARLETAARVFDAMRVLVLERDDRRAEVAEALGMSFGRIKALRRLAAGPLRMSELTAKLATDKPYTTLIVDDLERRGLVARSVHPDDRRCKVVTVTAAGLAAAERANAILARPPKSMLALEPDELAALDRLMAKL